ncbi:bacillithiol biosynthesis cysteine-adding enzyme BshC [Bacillus sp. DNRA2]|uniref:bacillithiol biosynthesis cysteine-adding enzyme BshC n=1 Tax=Bacillus sp. DNRA2 TaxID=2723053 RepID=UPI00145EFF16|nr:bacillithiol biosynthesis cysteine-adding enzyme BshC [Bacillus sp. DNRA2]NMD69399.1 bacillithiol biosynthesis cysteine-adding enzyme BshC [Bacillus sp. DNRA2]
MEMLNLSLPANNRFATEYLAQTPDMMQFFHYRYQNHSDYIERLNELAGREFNREKIADHIEYFMTKYPTSYAVDHSLSKLRQSNSVVVIGGQQAGVLTGPLYAVHKVISIIALAKQKESELGIPVVPIFWIAGEDHDYAEVNHIFTEADQKIEKMTYPQLVHGKKMVSDISLDRELCDTWVKKIIESFGETEYTKALLDFTAQAIEQSTTLVDFFAHIIMEMFKDFGLLIIDSGDMALRKLEQDYFQSIINNSQEITDAVLAQQAILQTCGYSNAIELKETAANLFYYDEESNSRILLEYQPETKLFIGKNHSLQFSYADLIELSTEKPHLLSNNVVTRPLTQEWLFPTLAFIAGPGEIAYWSELKQAFELFQIKLPPIVPRLNITLLERPIETDIAELGLSLEAVLKEGISAPKEEFLHSVKDPELEQLFLKLNKEFSEQYEVIIEKIEEIDRGLNTLIKKNEQLIQKQIRFLEDKVHESIYQKHMVTLRKLDRIGNALRPNGAPQERILNPYYFLNKYGFEFIKQLVMLDYQFDGTHKVVKL